ncbi:hypothetical protein [Planomonospora sp. ID82291]|uniref:hypothetical protein n=1 Tax=Planomonospora sp. ID82291 TaxID=2738136 RepID=UPI0018C352C7|nr:hypothetical protein [Planomonospora sp. ID82291]MBG0818256.1 hypothetical protein [Planomonospora sp. ID82291]
MLDLDAARADRIAEGTPFPLKFRGQTICHLPQELPLDVLEPLTEIDVDIALIFRTAIDSFKSQDPDAATVSVLDTLIDLLVMNKNLPDEVLEAAKKIGRRLLTDEGYEAFLAARPSVSDVIALVKGLMNIYGLRLGESPTSSATSSGGTTSMPTSPTTTPESNSADSGDAPATEASSESAAS